MSTGILVPGPRLACSPRIVPQRSTGLDRARMIALHQDGVPVAYRPSGFRPWRESTPTARESGSDDEHERFVPDGDETGGRQRAALCARAGLGGRGPPPAGAAEPG